MRDIHSFAEQVSSLTAPFVHTTHQCISELQLEITCVSKGIIEVANRCLPHKKDKRKKPIVKYKQLKDLCRISKAVWKRWKDAGRPSYGPLAEEKKRSKKDVRQFVATARARQVQGTIQERDRMFKENHPLRFKHQIVRPHVQSSLLMASW